MRSGELTARCVEVVLDQLGVDVRVGLVEEQQGGAPAFVEAAESQPTTIVATRARGLRLFAGGQLRRKRPAVAGAQAAA
jgi:hypothetical protein